MINRNGRLKLMSDLRRSFLLYPHKSVLRLYLFAHKNVEYA